MDKAKRVLGASEGTHVLLIMPISFTVPALFRVLRSQWFTTIRARRGYRRWARLTLVHHAGFALCEVPVRRGSKLSHSHHRAISNSSEISDPRFNFRWQLRQVANLRVALWASLKRHGSMHLIAMSKCSRQLVKSPLSASRCGVSDSSQGNKKPLLASPLEADFGGVKRNFSFPRFHFLRS